MLQRATLLSMIEATAFWMLAGFYSLKDLNTVEYKDFLKDPDNQFATKSFTAAARVQLARVVQHDGQSVDVFFAEQRKSSREWEFGRQLEERIRDHLLMGKRSDSIRKQIQEYVTKPLNE